MKNLVRIMFAVGAVMIMFFVFDSPINENETLEAPETMEPLPADEPVTMPSSVARPAEGLSTYIGQSPARLIEDLGEPVRIEPSAFEYEWWVYSDSFSRYIMAGIQDKKVVQIYTAGTAMNPAPFRIGQTLEDLYRFTIIDNEVPVEYKENVYTFHLTAEDMKTRLLVGFEGVYAQLYVDAEDGVLEAVRFTDAETLIRHQPYDMLYAGDLLPAAKPSSEFQQSVDAANGKQLMDLSNLYRLRHQRRPLAESSVLSAIAREKSRHSARSAHSVEQETEMASLADRLSQAGISFEKAAENTATKYYDAAEAVHGWLNSADHRGTLLSKEFNYTGAGAYGRFYTQDFISRKEEELTRE